MSNLYDFGLLKLASPAQITKSANIACLPCNNNRFVGIQLLASGWGKLDPTRVRGAKTLQEVWMTVNSQADCQASRPKDNIIDDIHLCAGLNEGKGVTQGDSGGNFS